MDLIDLASHVLWMIYCCSRVKASGSRLTMLPVECSSQAPQRVWLSSLVLLSIVLPLVSSDMCSDFQSACQLYGQENGDPQCCPGFRYQQLFGSPPPPNWLCYPCDAGSWSAGGVGNSFCVPTPAGSFSAACDGSAHACGDPAHFCPPGAASPSLVPAGAYAFCPEGDTGHCSTYLECTPGSACVNGIRTPCPGGSFSAAPGASACTPCDAGSVCAAGAVSETACPYGSYCPQNCEAPIPVPAGQQSLDAQGRPCVSSCSAIAACPLGHFCQSGVMFPCAPGSFADATGLAACTLATPGHFAAEVAAVSQQMCLEGTFSPTSGAASCTACPAGKAQALLGATNCTACALGHFSLGATSVCEECTPGTFSNRTGAGLCTPAPMGFSVTKSGQSAPSPCEPGTVSGSLGAASCSECAAGRFQANFAQTSCDLCESGTSSNGGMPTCDACRPGTNQSALGQSACELCGAGQFAGAPRAAFCDECPVSLISSVGASECVNCPPNSMSLVSGTTSCVSCLEAGMNGVECSNGSIVLQPGFWARVVREAGAWTIRTYPCPLAYCPGVTVSVIAVGQVQQCQLPRVESVLCSQCEVNSLDMDGRCVPCTHVSVSQLVAAGMVSLGLVCIILVTSQSSAGALDILLYFLQTALVLVSPQGLHSVFAVLHIFSLRPQWALSAHQCVAPLSPYLQLSAALLMPFYLLTLLLFVAVVHRLVGCCGFVTRCSPHLAWTSLRPSQYTRAAVALLLFSYNGVALAIFHYLSCISIPEVGSVNFATPSIDCLSADYHFYGVFVWIMLIAYIAGFPVFVTVWLWQNRAHILDMNKRAAVVPGDQKDAGRESSLAPVPSAVATRFRLRWGALFEMYSGPSRLYWRSWNILRRALLVAIDCFLPGAVVTRQLLFALLCLLNLMLQQWRRPYARSALNQLEEMSLLALLLLSMMLLGWPPGAHEEGSFAVQTCIALILLLTAAALLLWVCWETVPWAKVARALQSFCCRRCSRKPAAAVLRYPLLADFPGSEHEEEMTEYARGEQLEPPAGK